MFRFKEKILENKNPNILKIYNSAIILKAIIWLNNTANIYRRLTRNNSNASWTYGMQFIARNFTSFKLHIIQIIHRSYVKNNRVEIH